MKSMVDGGQFRLYAADTHGALPIFVEPNSAFREELLD